MRRACLLLGWVLMLVSSPRVVLADGLRKVDRATAGGTSTSKRSSSWGSSSGGDEQEEGLALLAAYIIASPWLVPRACDHPALNRYAPYPFADGPGLLRPASDEVSASARKVAIALDVESGYMLQGVVPGGLALRAMLPHRLELDARFSGLPDVKERPAEVASAGTAHLTYRFAQGPRFDFRTGLGIRSFQLEALRLGFDFYYAVDAYIAPRAVWRIELHMGTAGDAFVGQVRTTVGVLLARFELYAGYDHTAYLSATTDAALGGPIAGLRAWF